jgi:hypothetical protein
MSRFDWRAEDSQAAAKREERWRAADERSARITRERLNREREAFIEERGKRFLEREQRRARKQERQERLDHEAFMNIVNQHK